MITVCLNGKLIDRIVGYGSWIVFTLFTTLILIASFNEIPTQHYETHGIIEYSCNIGFFDGKDTCVNYYDSVIKNRFYGSIIVLVADVFGIGLWINHKKKLFNIKLCNETKILNDQHIERSRN